MAKTKKRRTKSSASPDRVVLTDEEKRVALDQLGVSPDELEGKPPRWPYAVGGLMVLGAVVLSVRLVSR